MIAALSTFGALQINDRLQDERISTQNSRLASIEVKIDKFNTVERNSVEIREVRARVDRIERYLDRINNSYDKKKDE